MLAMRSRVAFGLALAGLLWLPAGSWAQNPEVQEQAAAPTPPEPPAALAQVPPGQAVVTFQNGELTIKARYAPLIDVLRAVCSQTGAMLDIQSPADERIFAILGPGRAREVLASLLDGSRFDYVMAVSGDDPNTLARVMVFPRTENSIAKNQATQPWAGSTRAAAIRDKVPQQQVPIQAKAEVAHSAGATGNSEAEDGDTLDADAANLQAAIGDNSQPPGVAAINNSAVDLDANPQASSPVGRPRHRRR